MTSATTLESRRAARPAFRSPLAILSDVGLLVLCVLTAWAHGAHILDGHLESVAFFAEQSLLIGIIFLRRRTDTTSHRVGDWVVASFGAWLPLTMRPGDPFSSDVQQLGTAVQFLGLALTLVGFSYLGRSFGVVAANRGLKVNGPYRLVRHPIYFSHTITLIGFVLVNTSVLNIALFLAITLFQVLRIHAEERVLRATGDYAEYAARVRWRLLPGLY